MLAFVPPPEHIANSFRTAILGTGCGFVNEAERACDEFELAMVLMERSMVATGRGL